MPGSRFLLLISCGGKGATPCLPNDQAVLRDEVVGGAVPDARRVVSIQRGGAAGLGHRQLLSP